MNKIYLLDSPILTQYGVYRWEGPVPLLDALGILGEHSISAIGRQATADVLSALLGIQITANRIKIKMEPGDKAIVFRILERLPEGKILSHSEMNKISYDLGLLTLLAKLSSGVEWCGNSGANYYL